MLGVMEMPAGSWKSSISTEMVVEDSVRLNHLSVGGQALYFEEMRPSKGGKVMLVRFSSKKEEDLLPSSYSVRTRINEYGGKSHCIAEEKVFFIHQEDQSIYWVDLQQKIHRLTAKQEARFGDLVFDHKRDRLLAVQESMGKHSIVSIDLQGNKEVLLQGSDFYSSLSLSPDGSKLAYLCWDFPYMPWDAARLMVLHLKEEGSVRDVEFVAGKEGSSVFQPTWSKQGKLYFVWEKSGFWNLYCQEKEKIEPLLPLEAEFAVPAWIGGLSTYTFVGKSEEKILCSYIQKGIGHLALLDLASRRWKEIETPFTYFGSLTSRGETAFFFAGSPLHFPSIVQMDIRDGTFEIIKESLKLSLPSSEISLPKEIEFPTTQQDAAFGFYYPPKNSSYQLKEGEKPPLIVLAHGGPTAQVFPALNLAIQYWTHRGYALVDVNYRGSTGYGRLFREKLVGHMFDSVEDCIAAAKDLVKKGLADEKRLIIKGGSAGGYAVLAALAFDSTFQIGVSYYGVSDLEALAKETHKFESHYLDRLVGPYPEEKERFQKLSPYYFAHKISAPVLFFQGTEDKIVLPDQTHKMFEVLKEKGIPTATLVFEHEGHGFVRKETQKRCLEAEEYFYSRIFGMPLSEKIAPIAIENFP
jgi:acetyl esterase/lipase